MGKLITKKVFYDLLSNLIVKCWQSKMYVYLTKSAVAAAGFQTYNLIPKKCSKLEKTAFFLWVYYSDASSFYQS